MESLVQSPDGSAICDCHVHFFGDECDYPRGSVSGYSPSSVSVADYKKDNIGLGVTRIVCVQSTVYADDHRCMLDQMDVWGEGARGIGVVSLDAETKHLELLSAKGIRGVRAFLGEPDSFYTWQEIAPLDRLIQNVNWHIELRLNGRELEQKLSTVSQLSSPIVIDHIARFIPMVDENHPAFIALLRLIDAGSCWVKLSAPYASSQSGGPEYNDVSALVRALVDFAPERMLWGSNWPHTTQEAHPTSQELVDLAQAWCPDDSVLHQIACLNPGEVYGFED